MKIALLCLLASVQAPDAGYLARTTPLEGTQPAHGRVVWTEEPATRATISWTTLEAGESHVVLFDTEPRGGDSTSYRLRRASDRDGVFSKHEGEKGPTAHYHHARLEGLEPSTTYWFTIVSDGRESRELHFTTAPVDERPFALINGGDSRTGWLARCVVNTQIARLSAQDPTLLALVHGGDYVTHGPRFDQWSRWLSHNELTTTADGRVLPIVPARGNHDYGPLFSEVFDTPIVGEAIAFLTRIGGAAIATLDTNASAAGAQLDWLEETLPRERASARWLLANYHVALYPGVKAPGPAKPFWTPVFDRNGMDLVLESDGHVQKRTLAIKGDEADPTGTVYVGEGGLGVQQRTPRKGLWYLQPPGRASRGHHVIRLDVAPDALRIRFLEFDPPVEQPPSDAYELVVAPGATWRYLGGSDPAAEWTSATFEDSAWSEGAAGFGYGDDDDATVLEGMQRKYARLYARTSFDRASVASTEALTLFVRYDDGFVAYLNGVEVARGGVESGAGPAAEGVANHEARRFEAFELANWRALLRDGENVLAIEGHNRTRGSTDFTLDPWLAGDARQDAVTELPAPRVVDDHTLSPRS